MLKVTEPLELCDRLKSLLATFSESLEVDDGEITFNYGLPLDGAKQETVSVLGIVPWWR